MPRAATAIIAIACSASYLGADTSIISQLPSKSRRKRASPKQHLLSQHDMPDKEDEIFIECSHHWSKVTDGLDGFGTEQQRRATATSELAGLEAGLEVLYSNVDMGIGISVGCRMLELGTSKEQRAWPEEAISRVAEYMGAQGRALFRAAKQWCDQSWEEDELVPTFPVSMCVKQFYNFGMQQPVTTTWSIDVVSPSASGVLRMSAESSNEDTSVREITQSGDRVLRLCRELRQLQTTLGQRHREDGRTQVEISATDAKGRLLLDHRYEHCIFCSKSDDLLELLTEAQSEGELEDAEELMQEFPSATEGSLEFEQTSSEVHQRTRPRGEKPMHRLGNDCSALHSYS